MKETKRIMTQLIKNFCVIQKHVAKHGTDAEKQGFKANIDLLNAHLKHAVIISSAEIATLQKVK